MTGQRSPLFWKGDDREARFDLYDLKGLLEEFLDQFGLRGLTYARRPDSATVPLNPASPESCRGFPLSPSEGERAGVRGNGARD